MRVSSLRLLNIRKFEEQGLSDLHTRLNVIVGSNAQGKTSILESLSLFTNLKSFRTHKTNEIIRGGESQASVTIDLTNPSRSRVIVGLEGNKKQILVDNKEINSKSRYPFLGSSVSFCPDDLNLVKGGPESRRQFLDDLGISLDPSFAKILYGFEQVLKQRNKLLKSIKTGNFHYEEYSLWTEKFVEAAVPVYEGRLRFVKTLSETFPRIYKELFRTAESVSISYQHGLTANELIADALFQKINQLGEAERALGYSLVGPHRDDLAIQIDGFHSKVYGSQGQIRGLVIGLKVAQLELTRAYRSWSPILLLDDIISELDNQRVNALVDYLSNYPGQLFVTTAEVDKVKTLHRQFSSFKIIDLTSQIPLLDGARNELFSV